MPSRRSPLPLTSVPVELLFQTADYLATEDLYSLCCATAGLSDVLGHYLYRRLLLDHSNSAGRALFWACTHGHPGIVRFLLDHADRTTHHPIPLPDDLISYRGPEAESPLIAAIRADRGCIVRIFRWGEYTMKEGARPAEPLDLLESSRRIEIVRLLLIRGVNFDGVDGDQKAALHYCSQYGDSVLSHLLLTCGAKASTVDYSRLTPLHLAVTCNRRETLKVLLSFESVRRTIDMCTEDDDTALILAVEAGYTEIVEMLLEYGADFTLCNSNGYSPLSIAEMNGNRQVVAVLHSFGARGRLTPGEEEGHQVGSSNGDSPQARRSTIGSSSGGENNLEVEAGLTASCDARSTHHHSIPSPPTHTCT